MKKRSPKLIGLPEINPNPSAFSSKCNCTLCQRSERYYKNTENLPEEERDWMRGFYNAILDWECEEEMKAAICSKK